MADPAHRQGPDGGRTDVAAAVLAGGRSLRMGGKNKAFLEIGGGCFLGETLSKLRPLFRQVMIVGADPGDCASFGVPVHPDLRPGQGSLGGVLTALVISPAPMVFCVACDMPFLSPAVVGLILGRAGEGREAVVPKLRNGLEPLCAVYSTALAPRAERLLDRGERRIRRLLDESRTLFVEEEEIRAVDPGLRSFFNVNTPEDLAAARRLVAERGA